MRRVHKTSESKITRPARVAILLAATALVAAPAGAQTVWNLGAGANDDGDWGTAANWNPTATPGTTTTVQLNNVTANGSSGTPIRTVTVSNAQNVGQLTMTQTTPGFTNRLLITSNSGVLSSNATVTQAADFLNISAGSHLNFAARSSTIGGFSLNSAQSFVITNAGLINFRDRSAFLLNHATNSVTLNNTGTVEVEGDDATGGTRSIFGTSSTDARSGSATINNTGTFDVKSGRLLIGTSQSGANSSPTQTISAVFNNNSGGNLAIGSGANGRFEIFARSTSTTLQQAAFNNAAGATATLGTATTDGSIILTWVRSGGAATSSDTTTNPRVINAGTMNLAGNFQVAMASTSQALNFTFTNQSGGILNISGTGNIGATATDRHVLFTNAGTLTKTGSGTNDIYSNNANSTATNSGTMNIQAGTLRFHTPNQLANSGNITGGGTLRSSGINSTGGNFAAGNSIGTLTLQTNAVTNVYDFASATTFTFELAAPGGTAGVDNDLIAFTGLNSAAFDNVLFNNNVVNFSTLSGFGAGDYTLFTFDQANKYTGTLQIGSGLGAFTAGSYFTYNPSSIVLTVVPEPGSLALMGLGALGLLRRRRGGNA